MEHRQQPQHDHRQQRDRYQDLHQRECPVALAWVSGPHGRFALNSCGLKNHNSSSSGFTLLVIWCNCPLTTVRYTFFPVPVRPPGSAGYRKVSRTSCSKFVCSRDSRFVDSKSGSNEVNGRTSAITL